MLSPLLWDRNSERIAISQASAIMVSELRRGPALRGQECPRSSQSDPDPRSYCGTLMRDVAFRAWPKKQITAVTSAHHFRPAHVQTGMLARAARISGLPSLMPQCRTTNHTAQILFHRPRNRDPARLGLPAFRRRIEPVITRPRPETRTARALSTPRSPRAPFRI